MRSNKIGFGIFLIAIGIVWTLVSIGILSWSSFDSLYKLWPLLLVVLGISTMFRNNAVVRTVAWLLFLVIVLGYGFFAGNAKRDDGATALNGHVTYEKLAETKNGELNVSLGGIKIDVDSTGNNLMEGDISGREISKAMNYSNENETAIINIDRKKYIFPNPDKINEECLLHLNNDILWDMNFKVGASKGTVDMSDLKVRDLNIDTGAGKFDLTFGSKYKMANVKINAGASSFDLNIPKGTGVRVKMNEALSSNNFASLGWQKADGVYSSPDYTAAENKIDIEVHMGVGKFDVNLQ